MLIDSHCHINLLVKEKFDILLTEKEIENALPIIENAKEHDVSIIVNVGTSDIESTNCVSLARAYENNFAVVGIHPNDGKETWRKELETIKTLVHNKQENKVVGVGEIGIDLHYPDSNIELQTDLFKAQIELALENDLCIVIHSRDAAQETLNILDPYTKDIKRLIFHCFSYDLSVALDIVKHGYVLGIDGPITYPKNDELRKVVKTVPLSSIILETDSPYLPPQYMRGKRNNPAQIQVIAQYIADLKKVSYEEVCRQTTETGKYLFNI